MSLRLPAKVEPGAGLRIVLLALARQAGRDVEHVADDPEARIHGLRTGMKKFRALLRLAEDVSPSRVHEALLEQVRILKDGMAGSRDDAVIFKTVHEVLGRRAPRRLDLKMPHAEGRAIAPTALIRAADELASLTDALDLKRVDASDLKSHWKNSVREARRAMKTAARTMEAPDFHAWRKCVKTVWYQSTALGGLKKKIAALRRPAAKLSELLGAEHDLTIVLETVGNLTAVDRAALSTERARLRSLALAFGLKIRS